MPSSLSPKDLKKLGAVTAVLANVILKKKNMDRINPKKINLGKF